MANILVVDDDELVRATLCHLLKDVGHHVREAANGREALSLVHAQVPEILVTDIVMPGKEGIETILEIRRSFDTIKIIAISGGSGNGRITYLGLAELAGADRVISKPFSRADLLQAVDDLMAG